MAYHFAVFLLYTTVAVGIVGGVIAIFIMSVVIPEVAAIIDKNLKDKA